MKKLFYFSIKYFYGVCFFLNLESGFLATQGHCNCEEQAFLNEATIEGEELECASCGRTFSIVSGDSISDTDADPLKTYDVTEEDGKIYLNI